MGVCLLCIESPTAEVLSYIFPNQEPKTLASLVNFILVNFRSLYPVFSASFSFLSYLLRITEGIYTSV